MSLFNVDAPKESRASQQARAQEQARSDAQLTTGIQDDLRNSTRARLRRFGFGFASQPGSQTQGGGGKMGLDRRKQQNNGLGVLSAFGR